MQTIEHNWEVFCDIQAELGEGPLWDHRLPCLYWVDIAVGTVYKYSPYTGQTSSINLGQKVGCIALTADPNLLVAALKNGFHFFDFTTGIGAVIADPEVNKLDNRFNDGKVSPEGELWAGTMDEVANTKGAAALYKLQSNHQVKTLVSNISCSNGLAWSPDKKKFYLIDTGVRTLFAFDYNNGVLSNQQICMTFKDDGGIPDGMAMDTEGKLWIAHWNGYKVVRYDPTTGEALMEIKLPVAKITSCCFGGQNLTDLYITSAKIGLTDEQLADQPLAGSTFVIGQIGFMGLSSNIIK